MRSDRTGEVVYKDTFPSSVASIVRSDYRLDGNEEVVCVSVDGEGTLNTRVSINLPKIVRGYLQTVQGQPGSLMNQNLEEDILLELTQKKQVKYSKMILKLF